MVPLLAFTPLGMLNYKQADQPVLTFRSADAGADGRKSGSESI
jgi:hypothetical protein